MRRTGKRSESPYNEVNSTGPTVQGVYKYLELAARLAPAAARRRTLAQPSPIGLSSTRLDTSQDVDAGDLVTPEGYS